MRKSIILFSLALFLISSTNLLKAQNQTNRLISRNLRSLGMGGAAVAIPSADNPFFFNPALLAAVQRTRLNLLDLRIRINQGFFDQLNFYLDHKEELNNSDNLSSQEQNQLFSDALREAQKLANVIVDGPVPVNFVTRNFGIGFFSQANLKYEIFAGAAGLPLLDVNLHGGALFMASYAKTLTGLLPNPLSIGLSAKYLIRGQTHKTKTLSGLSSSEEFEVWDAKAFSIDLGFLYPLTRNLHLAAAFYDINSPELTWEVNVDNPVTPAPPNQIKSTMRVGLAYYPHIKIGKFLYNLSLALDIDRPFNSEVTFFKKIFFGSEANITPILRVRGGFYQGYPAFGIGVNFHVIRADFAFYGEELGKYAGEFVSWNRAISLQIGF